MSHATKSKEAQALQALLKKSGLSQVEFTQRCKIDRRTWQRWEYGDTSPKPTAAQIKQICCLCNITANQYIQLMTGEITAEELPATTTQTHA